jgi:hypothetical protein
MDKITFSDEAQQFDYMLNNILSNCDADIRHLNELRTSILMIKARLADGIQPTFNELKFLFSMNEYRRKNGSGLLKVSTDNS